ncbi:MFS transporter [Chromatocurvus halotolerans]|uniref:Sugar phosphate permease n=1 Tax=Chromatocurvus halotolerans TaxID=1132028 RepID=A0A4R2L3C9_9GAMM|nr:MFS transporter [Chromatocurvus halotolerans]TCO78306.1 sugar phosphate permease [Chromatocurvus halotolerans]
MASLILAGDSIYLLVYMRQSYQTSMQEVFGVTFTQLGVMNSMYGLLAITAYFAGGWLSDRIATRTLLVFSLFATGLGGYYMATIPSYPMLLALHAFWGVSTILTFWSALIKSARLWGSAGDQGKTFGILDAGRGLVGAIMFTAGAWVFSRYVFVADGLIAVIMLYASASIVAGCFVWAFIPEDSAHGSLRGGKREAVPAGQLRLVVRLPAVWLQAFIILLAYWLYLGSFEFATFAEKVFGQDKLFGATLSAYREWLRPLSAITAGILADRIRPTRAVMICFVAAAVGYAVLAAVPGDVALLWMLWIQVATVAMAVFALRGIYFALMEESRVPLLVTGTAVGLVSTIGFTADVFAYPMIGWLLDTFGAKTGYTYYFSLLSCAATVGFVLTLLLAGYNHRGSLSPLATSEASQDQRAPD